MVGLPEFRSVPAPSAPEQPSARSLPRDGSAGPVAGEPPHGCPAPSYGGERRAERAAAANLEEATHTTERLLRWMDSDLGLREGKSECSYKWAVRLVEYPDGFRVSCYRRRGEAFASRSGVGDADSCLSPSSVASTQDDGARYESSIRRSRALVLHRTRCLCPHSLWTFTRRGKFASLDELWRAWALFRKGARRRLGGSWSFVAVPELHSDGETWHLHVAFNRWCDVVTLRRLWYRALGGSGKEAGADTPGSVNVKSFGRGSTSPKRLAGYISKYVGKGFERGGANRRVFASSVGLHPVRVERWHHAFDDGVGTMVATVGRWLYNRFSVPEGTAWYFSGAVEGFIFNTG